MSERNGVLTHGSLFSGVEGMGLGLEWSGLVDEPLWQVEWDDPATSVLERHYPDVTRYRDVRDVDWTAVEPPEVLSGGYPCQPFSKAGKRQGERDERHMWPYYLDAIRTLRPRLAILENVAGHFSLGFGRVLGDLAEAGFDAVWTSLRASDVGAPHQRERAFIVAFPADADSVGRLHGEAVLDAAEARLHALRDAPTGTAASDPESAQPADEPPRRHERVQAVSSLSRAGDRDPEWRDASGAGVVGRSPGLMATAWGEFEPAIRRWERLTGRPAPAPTDDQGRLSFDFSEWMMGFPAGWTGHIESRSARGRLIGNAVVPQCAEVIGRWAHTFAAQEVAA